MNKFNKNIGFTYNLNHSTSDEKKGVLKFSKCDDKFPMHKMGKEHLKDFIKFAKQFESLPWRTIKTYNGYNYEAIPELNLPDNIENGIVLHSIRLSKKFRLIGYRQEESFYIVWFDINHESYVG